MTDKKQFSSEKGFPDLSEEQECSLLASLAPLLESDLAHKEFKNISKVIKEIYSPHGGYVSLPRIPIDVNVSSPTIDNIYENGFTNPLGSVKIPDTNDLFSIFFSKAMPSLDFLFIALGILNIKYNNASLKFLFGCVFGYMVLKSYRAKDGNTIPFYDYFSTFTSSFDGVGDKEANAPELFEPNGLIDIIPVWSGAILLVMHSFLGFSPKSSVLRAMVEVTRVNDTQRDNVSFIIVRAMNALSTFFKEVVGEGSISKFFHIDSIQNIDVKIYHDEVEDFLGQRNAGICIDGLEAQRLYESYHVKGRVLLRSVDRNSYDRKALDHLLTKLHQYNTLKIGHHYSLSGNRVEPIAVLARGPPGVGKSVMLHRMATDILRVTASAKEKIEITSNPDDYIYVKPTDKFWDGYNDQTRIVLMDDAFANRDTASTAQSDAQEIIKMVNSAAYCLPMADAAKKNTTFFRPGLVLASTNLVDFSRLESVTDYKAVERRFHVNMSVAVQPQYLDASGKVDKSKLPHLNNRDIDITGNFDTFFPEDFWIINLKTVHANKSTEKNGVSYKETLKHIVHLMSVQQIQAQVNQQIDIQSARSIDYFMEHGDALHVYIPQGGYIGSDIGSSSEESIEYQTEEAFIGEWTHVFNNLSLDHRREFYHRYYAVTSIKSIPNGYSIFQGGIVPIAKRLYSKDFICLPYYGNYGKIFQFIERELVSDPDIDFLTGMKKSISMTLAYCKDRILQLVNGAVEFINDNALYIGIGILLAPPLFNLFMTIFRYFFPLGAVEEPAMVPGNPVNLGDFDISYDPQGVVIPGADLSVIPRLLSTDLGTRTASLDAFTKCINSYVFSMYFIRDDHLGNREYNRMGLVLNVTGQIFMMNFHFIAQITGQMREPDYKGSQIMLITATKSINYTMSSEDFLSGYSGGKAATDNDLAFVKIPMSQVHSVGMRRYFVTNDDVTKYDKLVTLPCTLIGTNILNPSSRVLVLKKQSVSAKRETVDTVVRENWTGKRQFYALSNTFGYAGQDFSAGDCGSLLMLDNPTRDNTIFLGIHCAGGSRKGFSVSITQEKLDTYILEANMVNERTYISDDIDIISEVYPIENQGCMKPIARVNVKDAPRSEDVSAIQKSRLYNKIPGIPASVKTTSRLKPFFNKATGETVDPAKVCLANYGFFPPAIPNHFIEEAIASYNNLLRLSINTPTSSRELISFDSSLESFGFVNTIDPSTSAGWPHNVAQKRGNANLKKAYFGAIKSGDPGLIELQRSSLKSSVDTYRCMIESGIRPQFFYTCNLKDEKLGKEKALSGRTRMFAGVNFECLILFRMYFGSFMSAYVESNLEIGSAIGINPYSADWDTLARNLSKFNTPGSTCTVGAGDFKAFDGHEFAQLLDSCLTIINGWYGGGVSHPDNVMRYRLWAEISNARCIFKDEYYEWFSSMPSGNPMTAIINTMVNNIVFRVAWQVANLPIGLFNRNVYLACLGDDNIFTVHSDYRDVFNELNMPKLMDKCGMVYTTEIKTSAIVPFRELTSCEFLKRTFRMIPELNRWCAPLRLESIYETLYWTKKGALGNQITIDNFSTGLRELALHGRLPFEEFRDKVMPVVTQLLPDMEPNGEFSLVHSSALTEVLGMSSSLYF